MQMLITIMYYESENYDTPLPPSYSVSKAVAVNADSYYYNAAVQNWPRGASQFSAQPTSYTELTSTVNPSGIIEDRQDDDAINVLRSHVEGPSLLQMQNDVPLGTPPTNVNSLHSSIVHKSIPPALESFPGTSMMPMQSNEVLKGKNTAIIPNEAVPTLQSFVPMSGLSSIENPSCHQHSVSRKPVASRRHKTARSRFVSETIGEHPEVKEKRKIANNERERNRIQNLNVGFEMLSKKCGIQKTKGSVTKLEILRQALEKISNLQKQLRESNCNPSVACLKQNEEGSQGSVSNPGLYPVCQFSQMIPHPQLMTHQNLPMPQH